MKVGIVFSYVEGPWGGGNQFLKALQEQFVAMDVFAADHRDADVCLFNSHHNFKEVFCLKKKYPKKLFFHRVDGPISNLRDNGLACDQDVYQASRLIADGVIFQSIWSKNENEQQGLEFDHAATIGNAPSSEYFFRKTPIEKDHYSKIVATSWSGGKMKGFEVYEYLDKNLDFSTFSMSFIGNSPYEFKNISHIQPLESRELGVALRNYDIYLTASRFDPCSNALIEAICCGLPAVVRDHGGHPEILQGGGVCFNGEDDVIRAIENVSNNYNAYQDNLPVCSIEESSRQYYDFMKEVYEEKSAMSYTPKTISWLSLLRCLMR